MIDDRLCDVGEVAELGFPEHQRFGIVAAVAVFEAHHARLGERGVVDFATRLAGRDVLQRDVFRFVFDIEQDRVPLVEGSAPRILAAHANGDAVLYEACKGEGLGHAIVYVAFADAHLGALFEEFLDLGMNVKSRGIGGEFLSQLRQFLGRKPGVLFIFGLVAAAEVIIPITGQVAHGGLLRDGARVLLPGFDFRFHFGSLRLSFGVEACIFGINLPKRRMSLDGLVKERLRDGGIVDFAVAMATISNHVDDDVGAEGVAVFERHASHANDGVHIFRIHVKDGNRLSAGKVGGEALGVFLAVVGGESHQVVDDDVDGAARCVAGQVGKVHGFGENALTCEGCIAMDKQWEILFAAAFARTVLFGARAPHGHGIDRFQVAGIRDQVDVDLGAAARDVFAGRAQMVFHVARSEHAAWIYIFK